MTTDGNARPHHVADHERGGEQGFAAAQAVVGVAHALGHGAELDYGEAVRWCGLSTGQGDRDGQLCLTLLYAKGAGVERDDAEFVKWLRAAGAVPATGRHPG